MSSRRLALLAVPALVAALAVPGSAATPKPQIVDPKGDSAGGTASLDLVSVRYSTTGTGSGRRYVPTKLVITLMLAAPPTATGAVSYNLVAQSEDCGEVRIHWTPGTATGGLIGDTYATFDGCDVSADGNYLFVPAHTSGAKATWAFNLKQLGLRRGSKLMDFRATVDFNDPATGTTGTDTFGQTEGLGDAATGNGVWRVG